MNKLIYIILLVFSSLSFAQSVIQLCPPSSQVNIKLRKTLDFLRVNEDKIDYLNNCWFIKTSPNRVQVFETFVQKNHPEVKQLTQARTDKCDFVIEEESIKKSTVLNSIPAQRLQHKEIKSQIQTQALVNSQAIIKLRDLELNLECSPKADNNIEVKVAYTDSKLKVTNKLMAKSENKVLIAEIHQNKNGQEYFVDLNKIKLEKRNSLIKSRVFLSVTYSK